MLTMSAASAAPQSTACNAAPAIEHSFDYLFSIGMSLRRVCIVKRCTMAEAGDARAAYEKAEQEGKVFASSYPLDSFRLYGLRGVPFEEYDASRRREQLALAA